MKNDFNINDFQRQQVAQLQAYSSARSEFGGSEQEMIFLDANENPYNNGFNRYPDPLQNELKMAFASEKGVGTNQIFLGNGSDEALDLIFRAFCEPGIDNIITLPPTYGMYKVLAQLNAVQEREVLLDRNFEPNASEIFNKVDPNTKIIFLCSPNNPTGNSFNEAVVEEILLGFQGLVVIDEAYIDFSSKNSWLHRLEEFPNLIVTQTLSKAYGMAGVRLGISYASQEIIDILNKIKPPYNVNSLSQEKALQGIMNQERLKKQVMEILEQRKYVTENLEQIEFVQKVYASDANFLLVKVDDADMRYQQLLNRGIVVRNRTKQPLCENTLRFSIGTETENNRLLLVLQEINNGTPRRRN